MRRFHSGRHSKEAHRIDSGGLFCLSTARSGALADTSTTATLHAPASYFTAAVTPMFKSYNHSVGSGSSDNDYFSGVVSVPEPMGLSSLIFSGLLLGRRRHD